MENDRIISAVAIVAVTVPVGSTNMHLDITGPCTVADTHLGIEKVRTGVTIEQTGVDHLQTLAVDTAHIGRQDQAMLPHILHQSFHSYSVLAKIKYFSLNPTPPATKKRHADLRFYPKSRIFVTTIQT